MALSSYSKPTAAIATSGTSLPMAASSAMRAAPVRRGCSADSSSLMPSGKMATTPCRAKRRSEVAKAEAFLSVGPPSAARYAGMTPANFKKGHSGGILKSVDLPRNRG